MSAPDRNRLEIAIDAVAKRMVDVEDDADLAPRIVSSLPERRSGLAWLIPQVAMASAVVVALVWITRDPARPPVPPLPAVAIAGFAAVRPPLVPERVRTQPLATLAPLEPLEPARVADHERSLPPVAAPSPLDVPALQTEAITAPEPLHIAPIELADLPLSDAPFSPRN